MAAPRPLAQLRAVELRQPDLQFTDGRYNYVTSGKRIGGGGMGTAFLVTRWREGEQAQVVVAKTFREDFLLSTRGDEVAKRHFEHYEELLDELKRIDHPYLLPVLEARHVADNFLLVTPLAGGSLMSLIAGHSLSARERVNLLLDGLRGLEGLHQLGVVHRDFTLQNLLTRGDRAVLFDFDISIATRLLPPERRTWAGYYEGRILGAPEFSIAPELIDEVLGAGEIAPTVDVYAVGTALFALFTNQGVYGDIPDLPTLLLRITQGVVHRRESKVRFPPEVPAAIRPIIETCLEREPERRYANATQVLQALEVAAERLSDEETEAPLRRTLGYGVTVVTAGPQTLYEERPDPSLTLDEITLMDTTMRRYGYVVERSLGRVKGHSVYVVHPDPSLVADGSFREDNLYRKLVTAISTVGQPADFVETWLGRIYPILRRVRQGLLTSLYNVVHDHEGEQLLVFTEYVDDARFGTDLEDKDLTLEEAFGLGLLVALSIARLHNQGVAHNNVEARSLLFKGDPVDGRVLPLFVGLVEPVFDRDARVTDVCNLARLVRSLLRQPRIDALPPEKRDEIERVRAELETLAGRTAATGGQLVTIHALLALFARALAALDPNFELVRRHGGDVGAFADVLVRHALYHRLYR